MYGLKQTAKTSAIAHNRSLPVGKFLGFVGSAIAKTIAIPINTVEIAP
jgi:hypothetical protein